MLFQNLINRSLLRALGGAAIMTGSVSAISAQTTPAKPPSSPPEEVSLEEFRIVSSPLARTADELNQSATILADENLQRRIEPSLGETLEGVPGVASTYFGPGASRPIIRGLGGERIRVLTDGLGTIDVSANSPDHAVSLEPALSQRVEIIRGPSTLLHGSTAVGGVINVIDERIPTSRADAPLGGTAEARFDSVSDGKTGIGALHGGTGSFAWQVSGLHRDTQDVDIPGAAEHHHDDGEDEEEHGDEPHGTLPNSAIKTTSASAGAAWFWDGGTAGLAYSGLASRYGVPGHEHAHEEEGGEEPEEEEGEHEEEGVLIDLDQRRWDFRSEITEPFGIFRGGRISAGAAEYTHREIEGDEVGTRFDHRGGEVRAELIQRPIGSLEGAMGAQYQRTRLKATGEEAFLPSTRTSNAALFLLEELPAGPVRWQFGGRLEVQDIAVRDGSGISRDKDGLSVSAGGIWTISEPWALAFSVARSERLPTAQELFADGPHLATRAFEIGDPNLGKEKSTGVDVSLRRRTGSITGAVSLFLHEFDQYIYESPTAETADGLQVYRYLAKDARLYGGEAEVIWHAHEGKRHGLDISASVDWVRGRNETDDTALPRLPPVRASFGIAYAGVRWSAGAEVRHAFDQNQHAPFEEPSDGYTLLGAWIGYALPVEHGTAHLFLRGTNLADEEARPHTSFLKEVAPLPGRNITAGVRWVF